MINYFFLDDIRLVECSIKGEQLLIGQDDNHASLNERYDLLYSALGSDLSSLVLSTPLDDLGFVSLDRVLVDVSYITTSVPFSSPR